VAIFGPKAKMAFRSRQCGVVRTVKREAAVANAA
jgi:hypothetical protein